MSQAMSLPPLPQLGQAGKSGRPPSPAPDRSCNNLPFGWGSSVPSGRAAVFPHPHKLPSFSVWSPKWIGGGGEGAEDGVVQGGAVGGPGGELPTPHDYGLGATSTNDSLYNKVKDLFQVYLSLVDGSHKHKKRSANRDQCYINQ